MGSDLGVLMSVRLWVSHLFETDVTVAEQAANLIQADDANMAIQEMWQWKCLNLVDNFGINKQTS